MTHPYYNQDLHGPYETHNIGTLTLEEGGALRDCHLAYATFGKLNKAKSNAVLITTWYSGTSKIMEQAYVGAGRALDPAKYFIIIVNQIGNGLSTSPHNAAYPANGADFPKVTIGDDVRAQHQLLTEKFGIKKLALVMGGSMGAQQTYEWAVRYPDMVERAAPIAGTAKITDHGVLYNQSLCEAITSDPAFKGGRYANGTHVAEGLKRHARIWGVMGWSTEFYQQRRFEALGMVSAQDFIDSFMGGYFGLMDPNDLLCMAWKWRHADVTRHTGGDLKAALKRITAKTFVMPIDTDMFFPPADCKREQKLIQGSELRVINSIDGHFALLGADPGYVPQIDGHLRELLAKQ